MLKRFGICLLSTVAWFAAAALTFAQNAPLKIHMISASAEYKSDASLKAFQDVLEKNYNVACTISTGKDSGKSLDRIDGLKSADLLIVFARRMNLPAEQMAMIRSHWENGKPIVGIRTAGHAFQKDDNDHFDRKVLGGHYLGHYAMEPIKIEATKAGTEHPILAGVGPITTSNRLYKAGELASDTVVLQTGDIGKAKHPVTLAHTYNGGRVFFTSLGVPEDFADANFRRMLTNAVFWTTNRDEAKMRKE